MIHSIDRSIQSLADAKYIHEVMSATLFINPTTELVDDEDNDIFKMVMRAYTEGDNANLKEEDKLELSRVILEEALYSLATLYLYKE